MAKKKIVYYLLSCKTAATTVIVVAGTIGVYCFFAITVGEFHSVVGLIDALIHFVFTLQIYATPNAVQLHVHIG